MKPDTLQQLRQNHVIEQLAKFDYHDIEGKSYDELKRKLAVFRAMEVDIAADANKFF